MWASEWTSEGSKRQTRREISMRILTDLGEWSGIPEATESHIGRSEALPFWAAYDVGFIAILKHFEWAAEICVTRLRRCRPRIPTCITREPGESLTSAYTHVNHPHSPSN